MFRSLLPIAALAALGAAVPALAWTGTSQTGDYRISATFSPAGAPGYQSLSLTVAPTAATAGRPDSVRAWFIDSEGLILAPASIDGNSHEGARLIAVDRSIKVPAGASALVVLTEPAISRAATGSAAPAIVSQITLPAGLSPGGA